MADLPCPTCGSNLAFLDQYQRYYCHRCLQYAPEGYGDHGAQKCATCGGILSYVRQYGRMYCYKCNAYPPEPSATPPPTETPATPPAEPTPEPAPSSSITPISAATTVLVANPTPAVTVVEVPPIPEPAPAESKPEEAAPEELPPTTDAEKPAENPVAAPPEPAVPATPAEPTPPAPSPEMKALAAQKPAAVRVKLFALKKSELVDLCTIYRLDSAGSKQELQDRLLDHLHELEGAGPEAEAPAAAEPAAAPVPLVPATPVTAMPVAEKPAAPVVVEPAAMPETIEVPKAEPAPSAAAPAPVVVATAPVVPETPHVVSKAEHPCPTCGRELTFIAQYNRYYCYSCQRYAPAGARAKNVCPTCGATMRWIEQHRRWWCDSCQRYASADLPAPGAAAPVAAAAETTTVARTVPVHRHGTPASGAGLVGFGLALYIVYAFFGFLGDLLGFVRPAAITNQMLDALQFFAFLLVALGAIVGLYGVRGRD